MRISICIPTYNRGRFLRDLFESILEQQDYRCELEVVVSDNASTDDTAEVIRQYRDRFSSLVYDRAEHNMGADRNYLRVVELATGDWCWLMGSDDFVEAGAVAKLEAALTRQPNIAGMSFGRTIRSFTLEPRGEELFPRGYTLKGSGMIEGKDEAFLNLAAYYSYLSAQVVNRLLWLEVAKANPVNNFLNAYVHVYVIGKMLERRPRWYYLDQLLVSWREGNDSFLADGVFNRMRIDVVGYEEIARALFGKKSNTYRHINVDIATGLLFHQILQAKFSGADTAFLMKALRLLTPLYWTYPTFWLRTVPMLLTPKSVFVTARQIRRHLRGRATT